MSAVSKMQFDRNKHLITCDMFHIYSKNCLKSMLPMSLDCFMGSAKFFLPIYVLRIIYKRKTTMKTHLKEYFRSTLYAFGIVMSFIYGICIGKRTFGVKYYLIALCAVFSGSWIFIETQENISLDTLIIFNQFLENFVRVLEEENIVKRTRIKETLFFMALSGLLMHLINKRPFNSPFMNLWFYYPRKSAPNKERKKDLCPHKNSCLKYILHGSCRYFLIGTFVQAAKSLVSKLGLILKKPTSLFKTMLNKQSIAFGTVLGGYVFIYRAVSCYLNNANIKNKSYNSSIAGLLAGLSYFVKPTFPLTTIGLTTLLQILLIDKYKTLVEDKKLPLREIIFCLSLGFLFHHYAFRLTSSPTYVKNMIRIVSHGHLEKSRNACIDLINNNVI